MRLATVSTVVLILAVVHVESFRLSNVLGKLTDRVKSHPVFHKILKFLRRPPDFCNDLECPEYEVKKKADGYELRCYPSYKWAGTVTEGSSYNKSARKEEFMRLFRYIQGKNKAKKKIEMTVPVAVKYERGKGNSGSNRFTMLFFVPFEYQKTPPVPTDPSVSIVTLPPVCAYVRSYGGYSSPKKVAENLAELKKSLDRDDVKDYEDPKDVFFTGGYDAPWKFLFRHNEIWILQKAKQPSNELN